MQAFVPENGLRRHHRRRPQADCASALHAAESNTQVHLVKLRRRRQPIFLRRMPAEGNRGVARRAVANEAQTAKAADSIVRPLRLPITARWKNASLDACRFRLSRAN